MTKQMYDNKKYAPKAWESLQRFVQAIPELTGKALRKEKMARLGRLRKLAAKDDKVHTIIASCLWKMATGPNLPWGRSAVQPDLYSAVPFHEKVGIGRI